MAKTLSRKVDPDTGQILYPISYKGKLEYWPAKEINIKGGSEFDGPQEEVVIFDLPEGCTQMKALGSEYEYLIARKL